jgi:hypothetical protein
MRRILPIASFVTLSLLFFGACASTQPGGGLTAYRFPELKMRLSLPSEYCVITRDKVVRAELLREKGIDIEAYQAGFVQSGIYLNAMPPEFDSEYVLTSFDYEGSNQIGDFSRYSDAELSALITPEALAEEYLAMGIEARPEPTEKINGKVYFIMSFRQPRTEGGGFVYIRQYFTIVNGVAVNLVYNKFTGSINEDEKVRQRTVVESIIFTRS